eukprot:TRINITY_DN10405_c0_g1_i1.p1 TRINITY_DN10405_c0_g1~~TRINITY_DN10405_c0_g1_i1.p1  ORF type:complete len:272 (-),score=37.13 TRINITY_DN10405_c0_g1_i1:151-966(-)
MANIFDIDFFCKRADLAPCRVLQYSMDPDVCEPPNFSGLNYFFLMPLIGVICFLGYQQAKKAFENKDARGYQFWGAFFGLFVALMVNSAIYLCMAYDIESTVSKVFGAIGVLLVFNTCLLLVIIAMIDIKLLPDNNMYNYIIAGVTHAILSIICLLNILASRPGSLLLFYFILPGALIWLFVTIEIINVAQRKCMPAFTWLLASMGLIIVSVIVLVMFEKFLCQNLSSSMDGQLFFFILILFLLQALIKFFNFLKEDEIDDEELVGPPICC